MPNFQQLIAVGHVGRDAEIRGPATSWSMAVTEKWKGKDGQQQERTEWLSCVIFGERGPKIAQYIRKGDPLLIRGKLRTDKYTDRKTGEERQRTQIVVDNVQFLRGRDAGQQRRSKLESDPKPETSGGGGYSDDDYGFPDDVPF